MSNKRGAAASEPAGSGVGRLAYEAYSEAVGGHSVSGDVLPRWENQDPKVAAAWCAAAQAVLTATFERNKT